MKKKVILLWAFFVLVLGSLCIQAQTISEFPWTEDFESSSSMPTGWTQEQSTSTYSWTLSTSSSTETHYAQFYPNTYSNAVTYLITPPIDMDQIQNATLSFSFYAGTYYDYYDEEYEDYFEIYYRPATGGNWVYLGICEETGTSSTHTWESKILSLDGVSGTIQIGFKGICSYGYGVGVDNITIDGIPASGCNRVSDLAASAVTSSNATISWTAGGTETQWLLSYKKASETVWSDYISVSSPTYSFTTTPLSSNTEYDVRVYAFCGIGDTSFRSTLNFTTLVSCHAPSNLAAIEASIGENEATLNWQSPTLPSATAYENYTLEYKAAAAEWSAASVVENITDTFYTITELSSASFYDVRVKIECTDDEAGSTWIETNFRTSCGIITGLPWSEGFEEVWTLDGGTVGNKAAPPCWTVVDKGGTNGTYEYWWKRNTSTVHTGSGAAQCYTDYGTSDHNDWLISPKIALTGDERLRFWAMRSNSTTSEPDEISIFISDEDHVLTTDGMDTYDDMPGFTRIFHQMLPVGNWARYEVNLNQYSGNRYIAFVRQGTPDGYNLRLDDVIVESLPNCAPPHSLNISDLFPTSVNINFLPGRQTDNAWYIYYKTSAATAWDSIAVESSPILLPSLTTSTTYQYYMKTDCGNELSEATNIYTFTTPCDFITFPFLEGFEDYSTGSSAALPCYTRGNNNSTSSNYPYVSNTYAAAGSKSLYFYGYNNMYEYIAVPPIDITQTPINTLKVKFKLRSTSTSVGSNGVQVGIMTDPNDYSTFVSIGGWLKSSTTSSFEEQDVSLASYAGTGNFIAIRSIGPGSYNNNYNYLDNLEILPIPDCERPFIDNISVTTTSAEVSFSIGNLADEAWYVYYKPTGYTNWDSVRVTTNPFTIEPLGASTNYQIYMRTDCGSELSEATSIQSFRTECDVISDFPWSEGFEDTWVLEGNVGNKAAPPCWTVVDKGGTSSSYTYCWTRGTTTHTGSGAAQCYTDYGTSNHNDWLISPKIALTGGERLRFWAMRNNSATTEPDEISIFISDENHSLTTTGMGTHDNMPGFTQIFHQMLPVGDWVRYEVDLSAYSGERYIAFVRQGTPDGWYLRLDDVEISEIPACATPNTVSVSEINQTSVEISFLPGNPTDDSWFLYYKPASSPTWDSVEVNASPFTLNLLSPSTAYQFYLRTNCGDELSEATLPSTFTTLCGNISIPHYDNFDHYGTGESVMPTCWTRTTTYSNRPYVNTGGVTGNCLYFYAGSTDSYNIAALPPIDPAIPINTLMVSFSSKASTTDSLQIGVMTDPEDASTFELVQSVFNTSTYDEFEVALNTYSGTGRYIAFRIAYDDNSSYAHVDNLEINIIASCLRPLAITVNPLGTSATATWIPAATETQWLASYKESTASTWSAEQMVNVPSYTMSSLTEITNYDVRVRSFCNDGDTSNYRMATFSTIMQPSSIPFTEDFENPTPWHLLNGTQTNQWVISTEANSNGSGTQSLYISNNATATPPPYDYNNGSTSSVYAVKYLTFEVGDHLISYDWKANGESGWDYLQVWLAPATATPSAGSSPTTTGWINLHGSSNLCLQSSWQSVENREFAVTTPGVYKLIFYWRNDGSGGFPPPGAVDNVHVEKISCSAPVNLEASSITVSSARITWTEPGEATQWLLSYKKNSETAWGNEITITTTPEYDIDDLESSSGYNVRVRSLCGGGDTSNYRIITFQTACGDITTLPWTENFDSYSSGTSSFPPCMTRLYSTSYPYVYSTSIAPSPSNVLYFYSQTVSGNYYSMAVTPRFEADVNTLMVTFKARRPYTSSGAMQIGVMTDPTDATTFTVMETVTPASLDTWYEYEVPLDASTVTNAHYIAFRQVATSSTYQFYVDDIVVDVMPACPNPQDFVAEEETPTSVNLDWTEDAGTLSRILEYKKESETDWTEATGVTAPPFIVTDLEAENTYNFRLKLTCGAGESNYKFANVYIGYYCLPTFTGTNASATTSVTTTGASTTNLNDNTACTALTYYDRTSLPFEAQPGDDITFTATFAGTQGVTIWIDLNQDFIFDHPSERVYTTTDYMDSPHSGTISIPSDITDGTYRVRIQIDWLGYDHTDACENNSGNVIDYALTVAVPNPCPSVTNVNITVQGGTAILTWDDPEGDAPLSYAIYRNGVEEDVVPYGTNEYTLEYLENGSHTAAVAAVYAEEYECVPIKVFTTFTVSTCAKPVDVRAAYSSTVLCHVILSWLPPDSKTPETYRIYRDGILIDSNITVTEYTDTELDPYSSHIWGVQYMCSGSGASDIEYSNELEKCEVGVDDFYFSQLVLSPNPASTTVTISGAVVSKVEIYNAMGQMITSKIENVTTVDVSSYSDGVYFFKLYNANNEFTVKRVVIAK